MSFNTNFFNINSSQKSHHQLQPDFETVHSLLQFLFDALVFELYLFNLSLLLLIEHVEKGANLYSRKSGKIGQYMHYIDVF